MIIKTLDFQEAVNTILLAADKSSANLEILANEGSLYLNVTNKEYYVSVKYAIDSEESFRAVVDAQLFLNLISGIVDETFTLEVASTFVKIGVGKSNYKLAMIYKNSELLELPVIKIDNPTVKMAISNDILMSILNVNGKEIKKSKHWTNLSELNKLYYIDNTGCFTWTDSACLNKFELEKPVKLLLNDRIVSLFKLFKTNVMLTLGYDQMPDGSTKAKVTFTNDNVYVAALTNSDDVLLRSIQGPYDATKRFLSSAYENHLVVSVNAFNNAIARLMMFTKNSIAKANLAQVFTKITISSDEITVEDELGNSEVVKTENESTVNGEYTMFVNIADFKMVLDGYKDEHITINCGDHRSIAFIKGNVSHLISEKDKSRTKWKA